jgi:tetratricopeptide (TPR) repeat protein
MRGLLRASGKLTNAEDRTLQAIEGYVARYAHPTATDHDRLAAEMPNIVYAAAYAASVDQDEPIHTLINNLTDQAGDFVPTRGFQPELGQLRQLLGLFGTQSTETAQSAPQPVASQTVEQAALHLPLPADSELKGTEPLVTTATPSPALDVTPRPLITVSPLPENVHDAHTPQPAGRILPAESAIEPSPSAPSAPTAVVEPVPRPLITVSPLPDNVHDAHTPQPSGRLYPPAPVAAAPEPASAAPVQPSEPPAHMPEFESYLVNRSAPSPVPTPVAEAPVTDSKVTEPVVPVPLDTASMLAQSDRTTVEGLDACIQVARATNDHATVADCALRLGDLYMNVQDTAHAIPNYQTAIDALRSGTDQRMTALAMERLARAYLIAGRISEAAQTLESTASLLESDANPSDKSRVLSTLGSAYDTLQSWSAAQTAHERASKAAYDVSDRRQEALDLGGLAHAHQAQGHTPEAIEAYRKGLHVAYSLNDSALITNYATQLGGILIMDGKTLNQAVSLLSEAVSRQPENIDAQRLLKRGQRWVEQAQSNNVALPPALDNPRFARLAYVASVG